MSGSSSLSSVLGIIKGARHTIAGLLNTRSSGKDELKATQKKLTQLEGAIQRYSIKENNVPQLTSTSTHVRSARKRSFNVVSDIHVFLADYKCRRAPWGPEARAKLENLWKRLEARKSEWDNFSKFLGGVNHRPKKIGSVQGVLAIDQPAPNNRKKQKAMKPSKGKRVARAKVPAW